MGNRVNLGVAIGDEQVDADLGVAELSSDIPNFAAPVERADRAQSLAKQAGALCVQVYECANG